MGHPDSAIRLASAVHRFRVPMIGKTVNFQRSFMTAGAHPLTKNATKRADEARKKLQTSLSAKNISGERVYGDASRYLPFIYQILLSCKIQPESARLDERLSFEWKSGVEKEPEEFGSEALMYDMVMCISCQALGKAAVATECSTAGEFAQASREYAAAAGIFRHLFEETLPQWIAKGNNVEDATNLPSECSIACCEALMELFLANGQQMAVASVLIKPGQPNYSLLAKLLLGCHERLEKFSSLMRKNAFGHMQRMDKDAFTLLQFSTVLIKSLSQYFYARAKWEEMDYGIAIALLSESRQMILPPAKNFAGKPGVLPDIPKRGSPLTPLGKELDDLKKHYTQLLQLWEKDNSNVYFENVPPRVQESDKLQDSLLLTKPTPYTLDQDMDPLPLALPAAATGMLPANNASAVSDEALARELQRKLNAGLR